MACVYADLNSADRRSQLRATFIKSVLVGDGGVIPVLAKYRGEDLRACIRCLKYGSNLLSNTFTVDSDAVTEIISRLQIRILTKTWIFFTI
jgi:hypothetical protein